MKPLERGGAAAASAIERLRSVQRLIEALQVSPDSLLLCREHDVVAPLLEWNGANDILQPFVDALESVPAPPADAELMPHRRRAPLIAADGGRAFTARLARPEAAPERRSGGPEESAERARSSVVWTQGARRTLADATITRESRQRAAMILAQAESDPFEAPSSEPTAARYRRREWLPPAPVRIEWQSPVSRENAAHRLESVFARDERLLRAWERVVAEDSAPREVAAILKERRPGVPADSRERRPGVPVDSEERRPGVPVDSAEPESHRDGRKEGVRLQPVVDRVWRTRSTATSVEVPASVPSSRDARPGEARPSWAPSPPGEGPRHPVCGPARVSGLRRLASYGETIEVPHVPPVPPSSPGSPVEAPRQPARAELTRLDLGHEVAEIFRREALRHGIVAEEDMR